MLGCSTHLTVQPNFVSLIDLKYKLKMISVNAGENTSILKSSGGGTLSFYQSFLSPVLNSNCHHYPTDSRYASLMLKQCSWMTSTLKTTSRYFLEPDANMIYVNQTIERNHYHYVDLPEGCSL